MINIEFEIAHEHVRNSNITSTGTKLIFDRILEYLTWLNDRKIPFEPIGIYRVLIDEEYAEDVTAFVFTFAGEFRVYTVKYNKKYREENKRE